MSAPLRLTYAGGRYDRTTALIDGRVRPEGIELNYLPLYSPETFWRMLRFAEFDASELSCANYFILHAQGDRRFVAIPVFPSRSFRHNAIYVNSDAGIASAEDLKGRRVGVAEYGMTMAVWARGLLEHDFGVRPSDLVWVQGGIEQPGRRDRVRTILPPGIRLEAAPGDRSLVEMLEEGAIDALLSPSIPSSLARGSTRMRRLFPNFRELEASYFRRTRIFPIMHTAVLRREVYERHPWAAVSLLKAFCEARDVALERLRDADALAVSLAWQVDYIEQEQALAAPGQLWAYGFDDNRPVLEALKALLHEQGLLAADFDVADAFAPASLDTFRH